MSAQVHLERRYCSDLSSETHCCCDSCHEDADEGYTDLCELECDGVLWIVCCNKLNLLEGRGSTR